MQVKHIRKANAGGAHKGRGHYGNANMDKPTLCGAAPSGADVGNAEGRHFVRAFAPIVAQGSAPVWMIEAVTTLCPGCAARAQAQNIKAAQRDAKRALAAAEQMSDPFCKKLLR